MIWFPKSLILQISIQSSGSDSTDYWIELKLRRLVRWRFILSDKVMTSNHFWPLDVEIFGAKNDQSIIFNDRNLGNTFRSWYFVLTFQIATFQTSIQTSHFFFHNKNVRTQKIVSNCPLSFFLCFHLTQKMTHNLLTTLN